ncbi:hypothetical protein D623_10010747 [Myotis brandtii]|uniref:Uncharacterized protein n=1 Tax=Myotis brandtii TaxID=109478 RepID=S7N652_MYOBR|nr:hypothetical protein D623_10010747 [Myotis brandtii]
MAAGGGGALQPRSATYGGPAPPASGLQAVSWSPVTRSEVARLKENPVPIIAPPKPLSRPSSRLPGKWLIAKSRGVPRGLPEVLRIEEPTLCSLDTSPSHPTFPASSSRSISPRSS